MIQEARKKLFLQLVSNFQIKLGMLLIVEKKKNTKQNQTNQPTNQPYVFYNPSDTRQSSLFCSIAQFVYIFPFCKPKNCET